MSAIVRRAKYSYQKEIGSSASNRRDSEGEVETYISINGLMEMVNRRVFNSSVSSIDLIDELRDLRSESR